MSVVVATYNSGQYIIETLDSILKQTYLNLELIVTDDGSTDDTPALVKKWLSENESRFVRSAYLSDGKNYGIVRNANRGIRYATGKWIKGFAGDDILCTNAIEKYINYVTAHTDCSICVSGVNVFSSDGILTTDIEKSYNKILQICDESLERQKKRILKDMIFPGPTYFYKKELWEMVGGYDERYRLSEEWAFCYKVLNSGYRIHCIHENLVNYRLSTTSVCRNRKFKFGNPVWVLDNRQFFLDVRLKGLIKQGNIITAWSQYVNYQKKYYYIKYGEKKIIAFLVVCMDFIDPAFYYNKVHKLIAIK